MNRYFPQLATTGIGSLPHTDVEQALDLAFSVDIPYLPTLPHLGPAEEMLAPLEAKSASLPLAAWPGFLDRLGKSPQPWVKVQIVGPFTAALASPPSVLDKVSELIFASALAMLKALRPTEKGVLFFLDEPSLFQFDPGQIFHRLALAKLGEMLRLLRENGARVGIHCCGEMDFENIIKLGIDILSFDTALSLTKILKMGPQLERWMRAGGRLALGLIPTRLPSSWNTLIEVENMRRRVQESLDPECVKLFFHQSLLTPACGLGLRDPDEAGAVFKVLAEFQFLLQDVA
jgi:hypothetical protein